MRPLWVAMAFLGCAGGGATRPGPAAPGPGDEVAVGAFAEDDAFQPRYGASELQQALISERGAEARSEQMVRELEAGEGSDDRLRVARADLAVRRRFITSLEACQAAGRACPPRLDDPTWAFDPDPDVMVAPKIDAPLRFDVASWQAIASEMHGRACACRTIACVDSVAVAIDQLEVRPMPEVQGDELASASITGARECLFRLRGKKPTPGAPATAE